MSSGRPLIVSFATNAIYHAHMERLIASAKVLGLDIIAREEKDLGTWEANTRLKTPFLTKMLDEVSPRDIVWVDADAIIRSSPVLLDDIEADLSLCWWQWKNPYSGTLRLSNTPHSKTFLKAWNEENRNWQKYSDLNIPEAIKKSVGLSCKMLPPEYCWLESVMRKKCPDAVPVIEHLRESKHTKE